MQTSHEKLREVAREHTEKAIKRNVSDHDKKAFPRKFKLGDLVLLEVKDFLHKNKKLAKIYKGPYVITRISDNNTATVKTRHGVMVLRSIIITHKCSNSFTQKKKQ